MKRTGHFLIMCLILGAFLVASGCGSEGDNSDGDVTDGDTTDTDTTDGDDTEDDGVDTDTADGDVTDDDSADNTDTADGDVADDDPVEQPDLEPGVVQLNGSVEKGPFVLGSSITISPVDANGNPTGQQFTTQTFNDMGEFSVNFEASGFVSLEGTGFYYNEVTGDLSGANLTLRAFYEIVADGVQNAHLNLLTHLTYNRVKNLVQGGKPIAEAIAQAENELVAALPIGPATFTLDDPAIELTLQGGDTLENAYLFAVSAVLAHAARLRSRGSPDAALQELINGISADLATDGEISASTVQALVDAQKLPLELDDSSPDAYLIPGAVMKGLEARFATLGSQAVVPNLDRVLDSDFDSVANIDDNCWWMPNTDQTDDNRNDIGDVCDITFEDPDTGLVWQNISTYLRDDFDLFEGEWADAAAYCDELDLGGHTDWRLPSVDALRSLVDGCPDIASGGACKLHNNCLSPDEGACMDGCESCDDENGPFWKEGVLGLPLTWTSQAAASSGNARYWSFNFASAAFQAGMAEPEEGMNGPTARCVRGYSRQQELLCDDGQDDDGDTLTDCEDDDCFAVPAVTAVCGDIADLMGINSQEFLTCQDEMGCGAVTLACVNCFENCIWQQCVDVCGEHNFDDPACQACQRTCMGASCFGSFVCDLEYLCAGGIDEDEDTLTDMDDPDCQILAAGYVPDGDVDEDTETVVDGDDDSVDIDIEGVTHSPVIDGTSATFYYAEHPEASSVVIVGEFLVSPWNPSAGIPMHRMPDNDAVWTATVDNLTCGQHLYKFYYQPGGVWVSDPLNPDDDGEPNYNSIFTIDDENCVADGDVDDDPETQNCAEQCANFAGTYCTDAVVTGDEGCSDYFTSPQFYDLAVEAINLENCEFRIRDTGEASIILDNISGCDFSASNMVTLGHYMCNIASDPDSGKLTLICDDQSCVVDLSQSACGAVDGDIEEEAVDDVVETEVEVEEEVGCPVTCDGFAGHYCMASSEGELCASVFPSGPAPIYAIAYPENSCGFVLGELSDPTMGVYATVDDCTFESTLLTGYGADVECMAHWDETNGNLVVNCTDLSSCIVTMNKASCVH